MTTTVLGMTPAPVNTRADSIGIWKGKFSKKNTRFYAGSPAWIRSDMKFWIEWEDDDGQDQGSARWGSVDESKVNAVLAYAGLILGQVDTLT
jgi:hypothetical protein